MPEAIWIFPLLFFVALAYSSVGLGGGSSYVAFLYLFGIPLAKIPPIALFLNIIVASVALYRFHKAGYFKLQLVSPFLIGSIPATYFGAQLRPDDRVLSLVFASVLFCVALILLFKKRDVKPKFSFDKKTTWIVSFFVGSFLGLLAGIVGIGGGIFLGPVLLLIGFSSSKHIAATCSAFVLVNSAGGLLSHYVQANLDFSALLLLGFAVFFGGQIGAFLGSKKFSPPVLQRIFAFILLVVSLKLGVEVLI